MKKVSWTCLARNILLLPPPPLPLPPPLPPIFLPTIPPHLFFSTISFFSPSCIKNFDISSSFGVASTVYDLELKGTGATLLDPLNEELEKVDDSSVQFISNLNINYNIKNFSFNVMLPIGVYSNFNVGLNYNIN